MQTQINNCFRREADIERVVDLMIACRAADDARKWPTVSILRRILNDPPLYLVRETCLWEGAEDLAAFAMIWGRQNMLVFFIHPSAKSTSIENQVITWATERAAGTRLERSEPISLRVNSRDDAADFLTLLQRLGFRREDAHTLEMIRPLDDSIPEPILPEGFRLRPLAGEEEIDAFMAMYHDVFPGSRNTVAWRLSNMHGSDYRPELDLIAVAPDGTMAGFCTCSVDQEENARLGRNEGWTDPIGVCPTFRKMGLGRSLLLEVFRRLKEHGIDTAVLTTGGWNTNAHRLFESVGFKTLNKVLSYVMTFD